MLISKGSLVFVIILVAVVGFYTVVVSRIEKTQASTLIVDESYEALIDSLKKNIPKKKDTVYPFNPNYIDEFKAYLIGLDIEAYQKIINFRKQGSFMNSAEDFQQVTTINDEHLDSIKKYLKFPEWVKTTYKTTRTAIVAKDLNTATAEDLQAVYGIGEVLSKRIITHREKLGGFRGLIQLKDVFGITDERLEAIKERFYVSESKFSKINLATARVEDLLSVPYFDHRFARKIVAERVLRDSISWDILVNLNGFPTDKTEQIKLYLETK